MGNRRFPAMFWSRGAREDRPCNEAEKHIARYIAGALQTLGIQMKRIAGVLQAAGDALRPEFGECSLRIVQVFRGSMASAVRPGGRGGKPVPI